MIADGGQPTRQIPYADLEWEAKRLIDYAADTLAAKDAEYGGPAYRDDEPGYHLYQAMAAIGDVEAAADRDGTAAARQEAADAVNHLLMALANLPGEHHPEDEGQQPEARADGGGFDVTLDRTHVRDGEDIEEIWKATVDNADAYREMGGETPGRALRALAREFDDVFGSEPRTDGGEVEGEHHPDGFTSGDHHVLRDGLAGEPEPAIEDRCADCANEALNRCGCCGMPICGKHNEVQGGFCSRYFETEWAACVWPDDVYVIGMPDHEVLQTPGETDVFHVPAEPGDEDCTAPACREAEDGKEPVAMREVEDAELCELCEQEIRDAAERDGGED